MFDLRKSLVVYSASICCVKEIYCSLRSSNLHIHFLPFHQENAPDDIASLKKELAAIRQLHDAGSVDSALSLLRQHLARPSGIFDPHADLAALEQLVDVARDKSDERASRFSIVLRQTRPLLLDPSFQPLLLKLVGDKEEVAIAKEIQKALKRPLPQYLSRDERPRFFPYPRRQPPVCFSCGKRGHFARSCNSQSRDGASYRKQT